MMHDVMDGMWGMGGGMGLFWLLLLILLLLGIAALVKYLAANRANDFGSRSLKQNLAAALRSPGPCAGRIAQQRVSL
jgi:hypothetical protein